MHRDASHKLLWALSEEVLSKACSDRQSQPCRCPVVKHPWSVWRRYPNSRLACCLFLRFTTHLVFRLMENTSFPWTLISKLPGDVNVKYVRERAFLKFTWNYKLPARDQHLWFTSGILQAEITGRTQRQTFKCYIYSIQGSIGHEDRSYNANHKLTGNLIIVNTNPQERVHWSQRSRVMQPLQEGKREDPSLHIPIWLIPGFPKNILSGKRPQWETLTADPAARLSRPPRPPRSCACAVNSRS